jgi:eukaryotic-like serine/threonine-protein kinase
VTGHNSSVFKFEDIEVRESEYSLIRAGTTVTVEPTAFRVLIYLLRNAGRLVTKDEIIDAVWHDSAVSDNSLTRAVATLRRLLGDNSREPRLIATVQTIGYKFLVPVETIKAETLAASPFEASASLPAPVQSSSPIRRIGIAIAALLVVGAIVGSFWWTHFRSSHETSEHQLTINSNDDPVFDAAISGDGKYLAFSDNLGIHVRLLQTGETRDIAQPEQFRDGYISWRIRWLPDSTRFFAVSIPNNGAPTVTWLGSVVGGTVRKVLEDALVMSVSPDGSDVAFTRVRTRELWLMGVNGEMPRKLADAGNRSRFWSVVWSPDGSRLLYIRNDWSKGDMRASIETRQLKGGPPRTLLSDDRLRNLYWLPDGRILYILGEPDLSGETCHYWVTRMDIATGELIEKPTQLTHGTGYCVKSTSATSDAQKLVFLKQSNDYTIYVAGLAPGANRITPPKHLTTTEAQEFPSTWTVDSQSIIFVSNRDRSWGFYRQPLNGGPATPILTGIVSNGLGDLFPRISPDGKWLVYAAYPKTWERGGKVDLMKVPIAGGPPQKILSDAIFDIARCAHAPATVCAIAALADRSHLVITSFDPILGRGRELARFEIDPEADYTWDLSPDAGRIAILKRSTGDIHVLSLTTHTRQVITVQGWKDLQGLDWAADGKGLFTSSLHPSGVLLHVDLQGRATVLWEPKGASMPWCVPSPDGRYLAMPYFALNSNAWMLENF